MIYPLFSWLLPFIPFWMTPGRAAQQRSVGAPGEVERLRRDGAAGEGQRRDVENIGGRTSRGGNGKKHGKHMSNLSHQQNYCSTNFG